MRAGEPMSGVYIEKLSQTSAEALFVEASDQPAFDRDGYRTGLLRHDHHNGIAFLRHSQRCLVPRVHGGFNARCAR